MKTNQLLLKAAFLVLILSGFSAVGYSQDSKKAKDSAKAAEIRVLVEEPRYFFNAQSATPTKGGLVQLTPGYTLKVTRDTVESDLPYYGRAYQAGYGTESGVKFTSVSFSYETKKGKKGSWVITIKPKDNTSFRELMLTVYDDGSASLNVNANDRQPISYRGYVSGPKK